MTIRGDKVNHAKLTMKRNASFINRGAGLKIKFIDFDFDADTYSASNSRGVVMFNSTEAGIVQQPYVFQSCTIKDLPVHYITVIMVMLCRHCLLLIAWLALIQQVLYL